MLQFGLQPPLGISDNKVGLDIRRMIVSSRIGSQDPQVQSAIWSTSEAVLMGESTIPLSRLRVSELRLRPVHLK